MKYIFLMILGFTNVALSQQYQVVPQNSVQRSTRVETTTVPKCSVTAEMLGQVKSFVTCLESPMFGACGALGAYVAGRKVTTAFANKIVSEHERALENFFHRYREEALRRLPVQADLHSMDKRVLAKIDRIDFERKAAVISQIDGASDEFLTQAIPLDRLQVLEGRGRRVWVPRTSGGFSAGKIIDQGMYGAILVNFTDEQTQRELHKHVNYEMLKPMDRLLNSDLAKDIDLEIAKARGEIRKDIIASRPIKLSEYFRLGSDELRKSFPIASTKSLAGEVLRTSLRGGTKGLSRAVGFIALGGTLTAEMAFAALTYSSSTGCSALSEIYTNAEGDCSEAGTAKISDGVLQFLDLDGDEQARFLGNKNSKNCKFYEELYRNVFNHSVTSVSCDGNSAQVKMRDGEIGSYDTRIIFNNGAITNISSSLPSQAPVNFTIMSDGKIGVNAPSSLPPKDQNFPGRALQANKLFAQEIASCCSSAGSDRTTCLSDLNASPTQRLLQESQSRGAQ